MGFRPNGFLHGSLWLQATALVVLTSLLADSSAWIGAILAAFGLCFVCVGIGAAHMMSLGYLYSYATLVGVWNLLAVTHTLIVWDLITLPNEAIDPTLIQGQKIADGEINTLKIAVPVLYGIQASSWLFSLVCLVYLRVVASGNTTHRFEIQDPKRESATHSLEGTHYSREGQRRSKRSSRSFMGFRQSGVAPLGTSEQQQQKYTHMNRQGDHGYGMYEMQEPEKSWVTGERRSSQDSNIIIFPKDKRISQVVLTFRDDISKDSDATLANLTKPAPAVTNGGVMEARTVFITNHHYGLGDMLFDQPGESLSDMIFKASQPPVDLNHKENFKAGQAKDTATRVSHDSELTDSDTRAESPCFSPKSPTLSATTTLDEFRVTEQGGEQEGVVTELTLTPTSDSGVNLSNEFGDDPCSQPSQISYEEWISRQQGTSSAASPLKYPNHVPSVPERRSSLTQPTQYSPYSADENNLNHYDHHGQFVSPAMQPNTPNAHPYFGDISTSTAYDSSHVQSTTHPTPPPRPKPNLASIPLQYWRNRNNSNNNHTVESGPSSPPSSSSSVPFSLVSTFSKKKRLPPTLPTTDSLPQPPPLIIPTIVLHPDEEDGEPARVLSEMDIEYLSTMPPAPLRPLIPSWEEGEEDEYYDQDIHEGYDYDDYHQGYEQGYDEEGEGEEEIGEIMDEDEDMDTGMDMHGGSVKEVTCSGVVGRLEQPGVNLEVEYDPYALDVPIHLEIDLQGLEQGDVTGYGYI
ncbi:hypothetical protein EC957_012313 [Mortierella hygrophila]|uniref:Uncharacterized protein n=1 Tax=Mortierella hygrophila TaxID=979708 RepID=A0A9P6K364_9FUNG|nr:hypothetical protein EC957_012313 [Mortierella hygrophila]